MSGEDRRAHDVFREFRSSFGRLGAEYQHLMIFGQHGVSSTLRGLMAGMDLAVDAMPLLVLFPGPNAEEVYISGLTPGTDDPGQTPAQPQPSGVTPGQEWRALLSEVEDAVGQGQGFPSLDHVTTRLSVADGSVGELVAKLMANG